MYLSKADIFFLLHAIDIYKSDITEGREKEDVDMSDLKNAAEMENKLFKELNKVEMREEKGKQLRRLEKRIKENFKEYRKNPKMFSDVKGQTK